MGRVNFLSHRYVPPLKDELRLREMEKYLSRQSEELYIWLSSLEKRIGVLEKQLAQIEEHQDTTI